MRKISEGLPSISHPTMSQNRSSTSRRRMHMKYGMLISPLLSMNMVRWMIVQITMPKRSNEMFPTVLFG